jgi:DtxR family Mn-dependent transcriptional regulator
MATSTVEDYVKRIHLLEQEGGGGGLVSLGGLSAAMKVVPGTVTTMVKALSDAGLVHYEPRRGIRLTAGGEKLALHVLRRHRLVELFLVEVLKLDWSEVHDEAESLEHAISEKVVDRLDELLGFPATDPHGDPIPSGTGRVTAERTRPLASCNAGDRVRVVRVDNQDSAFLRFAEKSGLVPGVRLTVKAAEVAADAITVSVGKRAVTLGAGAAGKILVSV